MKLATKITDPVKIEADVLAVFAWKNKKGEIEFSPEALAVDRQCGGVITDAISHEGFSPETGRTFVVHGHGKTGSKRIMVVGLGDAGHLTVEALKEAAASTARRARDGKARTLAFGVPNKLLEILGANETAYAMTVGSILGAYRFTKHKTGSETKDPPIEEITLLVAANKLDRVSHGVSLGDRVAQAVVFARDLVNEPPSTTTPTYLSVVARQIVRGHKNMSVSVYGKNDLEKMGMGGILAIARGSDEEPKFIVLSYKGTSSKTVALAGKGITFDTGGLSLKPPEAMETMKMDMAGAAAILGIFSVLPGVSPKVNVVGLISATENMPGPRAVKPGDIVKAMNGKTIEILNTDAEGRVVLADALSYAVSRVKPDVMIDIATLTGACVVALGEEVAGLFASDDQLAGDLLAASGKAGEKLWHMPLVESYKELIKSPVADVKNIGGGRWGGAITAALFLQEFTSPSIPWAHMDIAGPAFAEKDMPVSSRGGTGFAVATLLSYLLDY